ncbi:MAG: hypothetical protein ACSHXL_05205, partial [Bacteroidota bacterium]
IVVNLIQKHQVDFKSFFKALGIAIMIAIPWQIYIFIRFPKVASHEMEYNSRHFSEVLEGHAGDWNYHFLNAHNLFFDNWILITLLVCSIIAVYFAEKKTKIIWAVMAFSVVLVYSFFSIAATKMGAFIAPVFPLMILLLVFPIAVLLEKVKSPILSKVAFATLFIFGFFLLFKPNETAEECAFGSTEVTNTNDYLLKAQWEFFDKHIHNERNQLMINGNLRGYGSVSWQFKNGTKVLSNIPSKKEIQALKKAGYKISCVKWVWGEPVPEYILTDSSINFIQFE